jgi:heptosyltransferase-2
LTILPQRAHSAEAGAAYAKVVGGQSKMAIEALAPLALLRFSSLGDVASAARIAFEARQRWPERRIVFITHARYRYVLEQLAAPVEIIGLGQEVRGVPALAKLLRDIGAEVVDLHASLRSSVLRVQTPTLSWKRLDKSRGLRRNLVKGNSSALALGHRVQKEQALLAGVDLLDRPWLKAQPSKPCDLLLIPGAAWAEKRWPLENFAELARRVSKESAVRLLYSPGDNLPIDEMQWGATDLAGDLDLPACFSAIAAAKMVLSNDTGFAHIAEGLGVQTRVLIGPTDQRLGAAPQSTMAHARSLHLGLNCQPCSQKGDKVCHVGGRPCLLDWTVDRVLEQL